MFLRLTTLLWIGVLGSAALCAAEPKADDQPSARMVAFHNYSEAIELRRGDFRALLCSQAGGRVLEFSVAGRNALYLDEQEQSWQPGQKTPLSAGRFDYGPELVVPPHPTLWSGVWTSEITGSCSARLTSPRDESAGIQLVREFELCSDGVSSSAELPHLVCRQTIINLLDTAQEVCHWGRSFSPGGGICLIPLGDRPSRFPSRYVMYEEMTILNVRNTDEQIRCRDGFLEILAPPRKPKLGFDSYAGWLGYLLPNDLLFVKRFKTYSDRVYNEAAALTLSVWYPEGPRIELEPIGPRERLAAGEQASFTEEWWLLQHAFPRAGQALDLARLGEQVARQTTAPK